MTDEIIKDFIINTINNNNLFDHELITNLYPIFKLKIKLSEIVANSIKKT